MCSIISVQGDLVKSWEPIVSLGTLLRDSGCGISPLVGKLTNLPLSS